MILRLIPGLGLGMSATWRVLKDCVKAILEKRNEEKKKNRV
jgi:hypothetical protein